MHNYYNTILYVNINHFYGGQNMSRTKLTWNEVCKLMKQHNKQNNITSKGEDKSPLRAVVVFPEDTFSKPFTETERSYRFSSDNKGFLPNMNSSSIFGDCLDGTDKGIRLDEYIYYSWKVDYCYLIYDSLSISDIKNLDKEFLTEDELEELEENVNVNTVECLGYSGKDVNVLWYDVALADNSHIDLYLNITAEE